MKLLTRFRQEFGAQKNNDSKQNPVAITPAKPVGFKLAASSLPLFRMHSEK